jgi:hypothetical protein
MLNLNYVKKFIILKAYFHKQLTSPKRLSSKQEKPASCRATTLT